MDNGAAGSIERGVEGQPSLESNRLGDLRVREARAKIMQQSAGSWPMMNELENGS